MHKKILLVLIVEDPEDDEARIFHLLGRASWDGKVLKLLEVSHGDPFTIAREMLPLVTSISDFGELGVEIAPEAEYGVIINAAQYPGHHLLFH